MHDSLTLLVKPSHQCNLRCTYCYDRRPENPDTIMSLQTVEKISKLVSASGRHISWTWHGGEPLCLPSEFYHESYKILARYGIRDVNIQSNGLLLTSKFCGFLKEVGWSLSFSHDGGSHDRARGQSHQTVENMRMYSALTEAPVSVIQVISDHNLNSFADDYNFYKNIGVVGAYQFNRVIKSLEADQIASHQAETYMEQYIQLFHKWLGDSQAIFIRNFHEFFVNLLSSSGYICNFSGNCVGRYLAVSPEGALYPCDFWWPAEFRYGHLDDFENLDDIWSRSEGFSKALAASMTRKKFCQDSKCQIYSYCNGGCNVSAVLNTGGLTPHEPDCFLRKREVSFLVNKIMHADQYKIGNKRFQRDLMGLGFRSIDEITRALKGGQG